jgi:hypothetical protein
MSIAERPIRLLWIEPEVPEGDRRRYPGPARSFLHHPSEQGVHTCQAGRPIGPLAGTRKKVSGREWYHQPGPAAATSSNRFVRTTPNQPHGMRLLGTDCGVRQFGVPLGLPVVPAPWAWRVLCHRLVVRRGQLCRLHCWVVPPW